MLRDEPIRPAAELRLLVAEDRACLTPLVYQEVLQGAGSPDQFNRLRRYFSTQPMLAPAHPVRSHEAAAGLYARCRWRGVTPRSPQDCLVAQAAIENEIELLAFDRDFDAIARIEPRLRLFPVGAKSR